VSGDPDRGLEPPSPAQGIAAQVVANTSLLIAVLVYMGWAYDNALYGYFHISPLDLDVGIVEYMLRSLSLFSPGVVVVAVVVVALAVARTWDPSLTRLEQLVEHTTKAQLSEVPVLRGVFAAGDAGRQHAGRLLLTGAGAAATITALVLAWLASYVPVSTYLLLCLFAGGPLLLTWPARAGHHGRFPYSLALVIAAVCALWAASLYANSIGTRAARDVVRNLPSRTAVVVYSVQRLALSGPGVTVQQLPDSFRYRYRYQGLRLLITRAGAFYLLPVGWNPQLDLTYILYGSDQIRIELLSGVVRSNS
jgi:hypothetical protein